MTKQPLSVEMLTPNLDRKHAIQHWLASLPARPAASPAAACWSSAKVPVQRRSRRIQECVKVAGAGATTKKLE